jgi:FO synthase
MDRLATALEKAESQQPLSEEDALLLLGSEQGSLTRLFEAAQRRRRLFFGTTVSYSPKVFIPLTNLCRDRCGYCTFRKDPWDPEAKTLTLEEVASVAQEGACLGCKEALLSLGDRPEAEFAEARTELERLGFRRTMDYLVEACRSIVDETSLFPHSNPGLMGRKDLLELKETNVSLGLMLESTSLRLMQRGMAHDDAPDKHPGLRLQAIGRAGELKIPFTTGILIGIGETLEERVHSLFVIQRLHGKYGHIQEVIVQNFRPKPGTAMAEWPEPSLEDLLKTLAVARLVLERTTSLQAPPNLSPGAIRMLLRAGINDFGGISPLTKDFINPEAPWPKIRDLADACRAEGLLLRERLPIYPAFLKREEFMTPWLRERALSWVDSSGYVAPEKSCMERGERQESAVAGL